MHIIYVYIYRTQIVYMKLPSRNSYCTKCGTNEAVTIVAQTKNFSVWKELSRTY